MFGNPVDYDEYVLPDFDPEAVVDDGPSGSAFEEYDSFHERELMDLSDDGFDAYLEEANPFDGSRYEDPDWTGTIDMNDGWE
jgi:hypothetical protein